jgi:hypothetical protein
MHIFNTIRSLPLTIFLLCFFYETLSLWQEESSFGEEDSILQLQAYQYLQHMTSRQEDWGTRAWVWEGDLTGFGLFTLF